MAEIRSSKQSERCGAERPPQLATDAVPSDVSELPGVGFVRAAVGVLDGVCILAVQVFGLGQTRFAVALLELPERRLLLSTGHMRVLELLLVLRLTMVEVVKVGDDDRDRQRDG